MDSHRVSVLPEHLKVVELGRRRWSEDEKLRVAMESLVAPGNASATARRHGISRSPLTVWRRAHKVERVAPEPVPTFVPVVLVPEPIDRAGAGPLHPPWIDIRYLEASARDHLLLSWVA